jgi:hypothetical protein
MHPASMAALADKVDVADAVAKAASRIMASNCVPSRRLAESMAFTKPNSAAIMEKL